MVAPTQGGAKIPGSVFIGISGWRYKGWRNYFYPKGLRQKDELHYASRKVNSIEINGSFYSLLKPSLYQSWYESSPENFCFAVKGSRFITHTRRLKDAREPLANFFASGVLNLREKLGPFLWQLPPTFLYDPDRLKSFFELLPRNFGEALRLSKSATRIQPERVADAPVRQRLRHALEVRHHSFENPDFIKLLHAYNIALVFADTAGKWPYMEDITSDFIYVRLHGEKEIYQSGYDVDSLRFWKRRILLWSSGRQPHDALTLTDESSTPGPKDVYVYFDNDVKARAPFDAKTLISMLQ